ncbi:MAG TPA: GNAT family N-acetyltransferase [Mucilaginibacter sp.]|jgi:GNAT superfamily N-acetyltransferase
MNKGNAADRDLIINLLSQSFDENPSVNYIVRQDDKRKTRIKALMAYSFDVCSLFGDVWIADDRKSCALVLYPDRKKTTIKAIWLDVKLIFKAISLSGISKTLNREAQIKKRQLQVPMMYLWFIGVSPLYQHRGMGSKLLQQVLDEAKRVNRPVFLETSVLKNIAWYERFGFKVYDSLELDYTLYFLNNL